MPVMCCDDMQENAFYIDPDRNGATPGTKDKPIWYSSKFNEYGLPVYDGLNGAATSYVLIQHCPWCGKRLPKSRRDEWFERLEQLGFDSPFEDFDQIPEPFKTSAWYSAKEK